MACTSSCGLHHSTTDPKYTLCASIACSSLLCRVMTMQSFWGGSNQL
jgi:hypothetical protein